jgi:hypothetical protein
MTGWPALTQKPPMVLPMWPAPMMPIFELVRGRLRGREPRQRSDG